MKTIDQIEATGHDTKAVRDSVEAASKRIAPTWPLDQFIAVNPYWGFIDTTVQRVSSRLESYSGSRMVMPRSFYHDQWKTGRLRTHDLQEALRRSKLRVSMTDLLSDLEGESQVSPRVPLVTSIADSRRDLLHGMSTDDFVTHNVSQHCASYFDHCQSSWETQHKKNLYRSWLQHARTDRSPRLLMGINDFCRFASVLPDDPFTLIENALQVIRVPAHELSDYLTALLMSINGWASLCAFARWQADLAQKEDDHIIQLLAIRLAWEQFAMVHLLSSEGLVDWGDAWKRLLKWRERAESHTSIDWVFQDALEISYQTELCSLLKSSQYGSSPSLPPAPATQAVFCIDVRSEVFRRALEACCDEVQTLGFAGFFGLPITYTPLGTEGERPQLPGLLAPKLCVSDSSGSEMLDQQTIGKKQRSLRLKAIWKDFRSSATSTFTFVESCGLFYAGSLLKSSLPWLIRKSERNGISPGQHTSIRPCLAHGIGQDSESLSDLVAGILSNMSLTTGFARLVLLTGHGSQTANNPHAASLDCGACGGQSGEVNARVLAGLLNDKAIRGELLNRAIAIAIPATTHFLAALHNTTTDEVTIFDPDLLPQTHVQDVMRLKNWLEQAGHRARAERAEPLGMMGHKATSAANLLKQFQIRGQDWSQVRPEWGLANNAAFLIAPRERSRGVNLQGRVFLHEYHSSSDPDGTILEAIMTAPMLVTNWINMQYYASTVDNRLYGSGNKVLHNVVGGRLGVFEGNGGDLRIGLPLQSLHDGHTLRHTPLRLSVFLEAPQSSIHAVILKHEVVRNLIHNAWVHLFQIAPESNSISRYCQGKWQPIERSSFNATDEVPIFTGGSHA